MKWNSLISRLTYERIKKKCGKLGRQETIVHLNIYVFIYIEFKQ